MEEARKAYDEALETNRKLAQQNPATYLPYVAMTLNNLGNLYHAQNRMEEAREFSERFQTLNATTASVKRLVRCGARSCGHS
jgi:tetratricopeptide (TPR) repeat protein